MKAKIAEILTPAGAACTPPPRTWARYLAALLHGGTGKHSPLLKRLVSQPFILAT